MFNSVLSQHMLTVRGGCGNQWMPRYMAVTTGHPTVVVERPRPPLAHLSWTASHVNSNHPLDL
jgi:hypothetical protein